MRRQTEGQGATSRHRKRRGKPRLYREVSLLPGGERNLQPPSPPGFFKKAEKPYGTRRLALLGIDVRRRHAVALDRIAAHRRLHCPRTYAQKTRTHRCYNLIYKKSRSCTSWFRRIYAPWFPI